jgi:hypothetical protein
MTRSRKSLAPAQTENAVQPPPGEPVSSQPATAEPEGEDAANRFAQEIKEQREELSRKVAELRTLKGQASGESDIVRRVIELLSRTAGATKAEVIEQTGAKKGYVDALLNRILPEKGYTITATTVTGERTKSYRIP